MAQMDPAATKSELSTGNFSDYAPSPPAVGAGVGGQPQDNGSARSGPISSYTVVSLLRALELAADRTATTIAHGTRQTRVEVRERLNQVVNWLSVSLRNPNESAGPVPPVIAREYVSTLKVNFLSEMAATPDLDANEVVRTLIKLDEAEDAWRRTDRS